MDFSAVWDHISQKSSVTEAYIARRGAWTTDTFIYLGAGNNIVICHNFNGVPRTFRYTPSYEDIVSTDWTADTKTRTVI